MCIDVFISLRIFTHTAIPNISSRISGRLRHSRGGEAYCNRYLHGGLVWEPYYHRIHGTNGIFTYMNG